MRLRPVVALVALLVSTSPASATGPELGPSTVHRNAGPGYDESVAPDGSVARSDNTGKGAVMCLWGLLEAARLAGDTCVGGGDAAFRAELARSITDVDAFILKNSSVSVTPAQLEARRAAGAEQVRRAGPVCTGGAHAMYEALRTRGATALRASTADALSVPREPVLNPCL